MATNVIVASGRSFMVGGVKHVANDVVSVDDALAMFLVQKGDATYQTAPSTQSVNEVHIASGTIMATGTGTTLTLSLAQIEAGDVCVASLSGQGAAETLVKSVVSAGQVVFTLSAAATAGTTAVDYVISRPV